MSINIDQAAQQYKDHFGSGPEVGVRAPGRVNIIGEHTDYNHGYVMPMALERDTVILARKRPDNKLDAFAATLGRSAETSLDRRTRNLREPWLDYVIGVADELFKLGKPIDGADIMITGDVPIGCGLSSSASLEMAALAMFEALGAFNLDGPEAARLGQRVENLFLGLNSGIMDQFISRMAKSGHALFLDCRTFEYDHVPVAFPNAAFVIANTCLARGLTSSKYNERVDECRQAVAILSKALQRNATHLRDFTLSELADAHTRMPDNVYRRARHIISENERTIRACHAMRTGDAPALGKLMNDSDTSLREDYEVTSPELDAMTRAAIAIPGCYGARMTGAGFGGCTINLVDRQAAQEFAQRLMAEYFNQTGYQGAIITSSPAQGASRLF
ncbi:MAG TPA: galactokinase [Candidatus Bathyarchaeia archaeon]|nr:galactokinase [Candidatus Bathyarchaeia archaeon]